MYIYIHIYIYMFLAKRWVWKGGFPHLVQREQPPPKNGSCAQSCGGHSCRRCVQALAHMLHHVPSMCSCSQFCRIKQNPHVMRPHDVAVQPHVVSFIGLFCKHVVSFIGLFCKHVVSFLGLFCRKLSLFLGSFAKETYTFKEPTNRSHPLCILSYN